MSRIWFVVPCSAAKRDHPAAARDLYDSAHFRLTLAAAETEAAATVRDLGVETDTRILSAKHGLVDPGTVLAPYDVTVGDPGAVDVYDVAAQVADGGAREIYALLPAAYLRLLTGAGRLVGVPVLDVYEGAGPGIGYQRRVASVLVRRNGPGLTSVPDIMAP